MSKHSDKWSTAQICKVHLEKGKKNPSQHFVIRHHNMINVAVQMKKIVKTPFVFNKLDRNPVNKKEGEGHLPKWNNLYTIWTSLMSTT